MTLKIAIDALGISRWGGGRTATLNLLVALGELDTQSQYEVFLEAPEPDLKAFANFRQRVVAAQSRMAMRMWAQIKLPGILRREGFDLVHHTRALGVFGSPCPSIVTIFDLTILTLPEMYPAVDVWYWRLIQPRLLKSVDRVIAISQNTQRELEEYLGLDGTKIEVVYPAPEDGFGLPADEALVTAIREKYGLPPHFFLYVGITARKKNLPTLLRAFGKLRAHTDLPHRLVLTGRSFPTSSDEAAIFDLMDKLKIRNEVTFTGLAPQQDLPLIYAAADLFIYPSLHEGFGLAPLEAMACGTPVITTRGGALPEAVGEAAHLVEDPMDADELAQAMKQIVTDPSLALEWKEKGLERAGRFTYTRAARETLGVYGRVLEEQE